jgi:hypothetical protein
MAELDDRILEIEKLVAAHDRRDNEQFSDLKDAIDGLRTDFKTFTETMTIAITGTNEQAGLRERVRTLENTERDRKWALRMVWAAVVAEGVVLAFRVIGVKGSP